MEKMEFYEQLPMETATISVEVMMLLDDELAWEQMDVLRITIMLE